MADEQPLTDLQILLLAFGVTCAVFAMLLAVLAVGLWALGLL